MWVMLDAPTYLSSRSRLSPSRASFKASHPRVSRRAQVGADVGVVVSLLAGAVEAPVFQL